MASPDKTQPGYGTILCHGELPAHVDRLFAPLWQLEEALKFHNLLGLQLTPEEKTSIEGLLATGKVLPTLPLDEKIRATDPWLKQVKEWEATISRRVGTCLYKRAEDDYDRGKNAIDRLQAQGYSVSATDCAEAVQIDADFKALFSPEGVHPAKILDFTKKIDQFIAGMTQRFETGQAGSNVAASGSVTVVILPK